MFYTLYTRPRGPEGRTATRSGCCRRAAGWGAQTSRPAAAATACRTWGAGLLWGVGWGWGVARGVWVPQQRTCCACAWVPQTLFEAWVECGARSDRELKMCPEPMPVSRVVCAFAAPQNSCRCARARSHSLPGLPCGLPASLTGVLTRCVHERPPNAPPSCEPGCTLHAPPAFI